MPEVNKKSGIKYALTEAGYLGFFLLLSALYFREGIFGSALLIPPGDGIQLFYPLESLLRDALKAGELPLWNPYFFGGMPLMGAYQASALNPITVVLAYMFDTKTAFGLDLAIHYALAGYFAFLYFRRILNGATLPALAGAAAVCVMGYLHYNPDHVSIVRSVPWLPLTLWLVDRMESKPSLARAALLAPALAMFMLSGNAQIGFYCTVLTLAYMIFRFFGMQKNAGRLRFAGYLALSSLAAVLISLPQLIATMELVSNSVRQVLSYDEFSIGSLPPYSFAGLLFPGIYDKTFFISSGVLTMFLGLGVMFRNFSSNRTIKFWTVAALVAALLALGEFTPVQRLMHNVPLYNMFRVPHRLWFIVHLALALSMAFGLKEMLSGQADSDKWYTRWMLGSFCFTLLGLIALNALPLDIIARGADMGRISYLSPWTILPVILMAIGAASVYMLGRLRSPRLRTAAVLLIMFIVIFEGFSYRPDIGGWDEYARGVAIERPNDYLKTLSKEAGTGRVALYAHYFEPMGVALGAPMLHRTRILGGYEQLIPEQYTSLLDMSRIGDINSGPRSLLAGNNILSMLDARVIVFCGNPTGLMHEGYYRLLMKTHGGRCATYINTKAAGRARAATRLMAQDKGIYQSERFDPKRDAVLGRADLERLNNPQWQRVFSRGKVVVKSETPSTVRLSAEFAGDGFMVLADQYYPGWHAYVDGVETQVLRVNSIQRGIEIPAGRHEVLFAYRPTNILAAFWISAIAICLCLLACFMDRKNFFDTQPTTES